MITAWIFFVSLGVCSLFCAMFFPREIVAEILSYSDGKTLLSARNVCTLWMDSVEYVINKRGGWHGFCAREIPPKELSEYLVNYDEGDPNTWFYIYRNWAMWQDLSRAKFESIKRTVEKNDAKITCIDTYADYIAVGYKNGRVQIFNHLWEPLSIKKYQKRKVTKVSFLFNGLHGPAAIIKIVIGYDKLLLIDDIQQNVFFNPIEHKDVTAFSVHKDFISYVVGYGRFTVEKISSTKPETGEAVFERKWFNRAYSGDPIYDRLIWNGMYSLLMNSNIRQADCNQEGDAGVPSTIPLIFTVADETTSYQILRDDAVIALSSNAEKECSMEIVTFDKNEMSYKKIFKVQEVLKSSISSICLYGNSLAIGVDSGIVYFYHLTSWKNFVLEDYQKKVTFQDGRIESIVAKETKNKRIFFVATPKAIHEISFAQYN